MPYPSCNHPRYVGLSSATSEDMQKHVAPQRLQEFRLLSPARKRACLRSVPITTCMQPLTVTTSLASICIRSRRNGYGTSQGKGVFCRMHSLAPSADIVDWKSYEKEARIFFIRAFPLTRGGADSSSWLVHCPELYLGSASCGGLKALKYGLTGQRTAFGCCWNRERSSTEPPLTINPWLRTSPASALSSGTTAILTA